MKFYLLKRVAYSVVVLFAILTVIFIITQAIPGSAADVILGQQATEERVEQTEQALGLDQPIYMQYIDWISGVVTGDWGESYISGEPVSEMVVGPLLRSLQLAIVTITVVVGIALPLGVLAATKRNSVTDSFITSTSYVGVSVPAFVSGSILLLLLAGPPLQLLPSGGYTPLREDPVGWFTHMILPVGSLTIVMIAHIMRQTRAAMIEVLESQYIRTARLKGLEELRVLFKHALRNALLPTITVIALNFGWLMGGLVIVEEIFSYPGIGRLLLRGIDQRDIPLIQVGIAIPAAAYIFSNLTADLLYSYFDPRVEIGDQ